MTSHVTVQARAASAVRPTTVVLVPNRPQRLRLHYVSLLCCCCCGLFPFLHGARVPDAATPAGAAAVVGRGTATSDGFYMPEEGVPHAATWMAFVARPFISGEFVWGERLAPGVKDDLERIANTVAQYEPVAMMVSREDMAEALERFDGNPSIHLVEQPLDDLWIRDTGAVFVVNSKRGQRAVDFNFNAWGDKQPHTRDAEVAAAMAEEVGVPLVRSKLVLEGGCVEVDGLGTAIIAESCLLNSNRNPGWSKAEAEAEMGRVLGLTKVIWISGVSGRDITDGHTDFYARFVRPGVVVAALDNDPRSPEYELTRQHLAQLRSARDARGSPLEVHTLAAPDYRIIRPRTPDTAAGYINFYVGNGFVLTPEFGDEAADEAARTTIEWLFPDRVIEQIPIDSIAAGGGGIHCATQQLPRVAADRQVIEALGLRH